VVVDEFTRRSLAFEVGRSFTSKDVIEVLAELVAEPGAPGFIRSDNGPEVIAAAVRRWLAERQMGTLFITPGSPWENGYSESFNIRLQDELLNRELFQILAEARFLLHDYRRRYNDKRPHSALGDQRPQEFREAWRTEKGKPVLSTNLGLS